MNVGGEPERDDFGLPPVDIEIPDDARELERDVQAYQRELRALRRRQRASRLRGPLTRDQMALPLVAGCLILALITSTLLIIFAADQTGAPRASRPAATQRAPAKSRPTAGQIGAPLPSTAVIIGGKIVPVHTITASKPAVFALVPPDCGCASTLRQLGTQAARAHVPVYLVGTGGALKQLPQLAAQAGQHPEQVADDTGNVLGGTFQQHGLTAVLVRPGGSVTFVARQLALPLGAQLGAELRQLTPA